MNSTEVLWLDAEGHCDPSNRHTGATAGNDERHVTRMFMDWLLPDSNESPPERGDA